MIENFDPKRIIEIEEVNARVNAGGFIEECENEYAARVAAVADRVESAKTSIVLASGPSASGKTTSSLRLSCEFQRRGHNSTVISLDDFFKNIEDYPRFEDGTVDMESVYCLNIDSVNCCLKELADNGFTDIPQFDFVRQRAGDEKKRIDLRGGGIAVIEGIHALNPLLSSSIDGDRALKLYIGLREEYYLEKRRILPTRDLRIIRRLVRDRLFRGYSAENTLNTWDGILRGEEIYIKPFKKYANWLLDTSHNYEPCLLAALMHNIVGDVNEGGKHRETLEKLDCELSLFAHILSSELPKNSLLREFVGGLEL